MEKREPKFKLGDKIFALLDNKIHQGKVLTVITECQTVSTRMVSSQEVTDYIGFNIRYGAQFDSYLPVERIYLEESQVFSTPQELVDHLLDET